MASTSTLCRRVSAQLDRLLALAATDASFGRSAPAVSGWSVGQHVEHLARSNGGVLRQLETLLADPGKAAPLAGGPSFVGRVVLLVGRIPRGRGDSPASVRPQGVARDEVERVLAQARERVARLAGRAAEIDRLPARFPHPIFGPLTAPQWMRFLDVHNRHHLRIVDDVERAAARAGR